MPRPRQVVVEEEGTIDAHDLPCSSGSALIQLQVLDNTSQISGTSEKRPLTDKPPYIPECEVFEEGDPEADYKFKYCDRQCKDGFIPIKDFTMDQMPEGYQNMFRWEPFQAMSVLTVKLVVKYTSVHRPDNHPDSKAQYPYCEYKGSYRTTRAGTGYIMCTCKVNSRCPCPECKGHKSERAKRKYFEVFVVTAAHVVFDNSEVENTVCEVFDDDPDNKDRVKYLHGLKGADRKNRRRIKFLGSVNDLRDLHDMYNVKERPKHDIFVMVCASHDWVLYEKLESARRRVNPWICYMPVIVSHPHGASKMVGVGRTLPLLRIQLPQTRTPDTPYTIRVNTRVKTEIDLVTLYPGFFKKDPKDDTWCDYDTTQPLHLYIPCGESNMAAFRWKEGFNDSYVPPEGSRLTSVDWEMDIPCDVLSLGFDAYFLLKTLHHEDVSFHYVYDIHTCKGSSGARVGTGNFDGFDSFRCHFGKMEDCGDLNRTGKYTQLMRTLANVKKLKHAMKLRCAQVFLLTLLILLIMIILGFALWAIFTNPFESSSNSSETTIAYNNQTNTSAEINKQIG